MINPLDKINKQIAKDLVDTTVVEIIKQEVDVDLQALLDIGADPQKILLLQLIRNSK